MERVGYLRTLQVGDRYLGIVMITDARGIPLEVWYSEPIAPTRLQRILYGNVLDRYLRDEILAHHLVAEVKQPPQVYLVHHEELGLLGELNGVPAVALQATRIAPLGDAGEVRRVKPGEVLIQPGLDADPLRVIFGSEDPAAQQPIIDLLLGLVRRMDLVEPLERVAQALEELCSDASPRR